MFRVKSNRNTARVSTATASSTEAAVSIQNVSQLSQRLIARLPNDINGDTQQAVNCSPDSRKQPPALDLAQVKAPKVAPRDELEKCRSRLASILFPSSHPESFQQRSFGDVKEDCSSLLGLRMLPSEQCYSKYESVVFAHKSLNTISKSNSVLNIRKGAKDIGNKSIKAKGRHKRL